MRLAPWTGQLFLKDRCKRSWTNITCGCWIARAEINFMWCFVLQCGMYPLCIVEIHIVLNAETQLRQTDIIFDFDVFVFQRPPETLHFWVLRRFVTETGRKTEKTERRNWKRPDWYFCWMRKKSFKWTWWTAWTTWTTLLFWVHFVYIVHLVHKMPVCAKNTR